MKLNITALALLLAIPGTAAASSIHDQLLKLDPEERAHQVCVIKGIDTMRRDKKISKPDRIKTSITGRAKYTGSQVSTTGGAVRAKSHWYKLKFTCEVSSDQMKALSFNYEIGDEIPESKWDDLGLWR